jgi:hypothetical protein
MTDQPRDYFNLAHGAVRLWIEPRQGAVFIKCVTSYGDPVELAEEEVVELIEALRTLLGRIQ